jgi:hypothetical protein
MKWFSIAAAITLIISCFMTWVIVPGKQIFISGVDAGGTAFGKPGYLNLLLSALYIVLTLVPKLWAKRVNIFIGTINLAWTFRNYLLLSRCEAGECPEKQTAIYIFLVAGIAMFLGALLTAPGKKLA